MEFPFFEVKVTNNGGGQPSPFDDMDELHSTEPDPIRCLKFPSLEETCTRQASSFHHTKKPFPSIRRGVSVKSVLDDQCTNPDSGDDSWLDLFMESYFPGEYSEKPNNILSYPSASQYHTRDVSELSNDELLVSDEEIVMDMQQDWPKPSTYSDINKSASGGPKIPQVGNPQQQTQSIYGPQIGVPAGILSSEEPTLLTLTSFPFRVMYSNQAFSKLRGRKTSVIGDSVFDIVQMERTLFLPLSMSTYPTLPGNVALVQSFAAPDQDHLHRWIKCSVQVQNVMTKVNDGTQIRYLAVRFTPQHSAPRL